MKKVAFLLFIAAFITSCDPVHYMSFTNKTDKKAKVKIKIRSSARSIFATAADEYQIDGDSIVINLKGKESKSMNFGLGKWGDYGIKELAASITSLEVESSEIITTYKTDSSRENLFIDNKDNGLMTSEIEIEIE